MRPGATETPRTLIGPVFPQKRSVEKPSATVGMTNGMSARASRMLIHRDFPRAMYQAKGSPARRSRVATDSAIANDQNIEASARLRRSLLERTCPARSSLKVIPRIGGSRMKETRKMTARM